MANEQDMIATRGIRLWLDVAAVGELSDAQLLDRFTTGDGPSADIAFAALVARHGPMVLRTCRAVLHDGNDVEDAFQATFLVLIRRYGTLRVDESLAPWLHRVASRVAMRSQIDSTRRRRHEQQAAASRGESCESGEPQDRGPILHAEIDRLPARYRGPVVLCDLEGLTHEQAARQLGCPVGTVKSRLARARERLRTRLTRRGIVPAGGLGALLAEQSAAAVSPTLARATVCAASRFTTLGQSATGTVPAAVVTLAERVVNTMSLNMMAKQFAWLLVGAAVAAGAIVLGAANPAPGPAAIALAAPILPEKPVLRELQPFQGFWKMELCDTAAEGFGAELREVRKWRWTVKGDQIIWARQGEEWKMSLEVDPTRKPKEIDLTYLSGPYKGAKCLGMYEWGGIDGKTLMISIQDPGANVPRPNAIRMTGTSQNSLIFLRKIEPVDPEKERAAFQGTWTFKIAQTDAWPIPTGNGPDKTGQGSERQWIVKGNEITWISPDGQKVRVRFTIDPNKVPRQLDFTFVSGPHKGVASLGVYEWGGVDGNQLHLCMVDPGSNAPRPKDISYKSNGERSLIVLAP
jgi:RNA polymerase sigma factor (sigma-70 family)